MASYTIELRRLCEIYGREEIENWFKNYNLADFLTPDQIAQIEKYNVWSKDKLARKIVDNFYMREIGFETPELFKHYAKITMENIMGRQLLNIYTNFLEYDPLSSVDYVEEYKREIEGVNNGNSNSSSNSQSEGLNINNDTPQTRISKQDLATGAYASQVGQADTKSNMSDETITKSTSKTVEKYTHTMKGDNGVIVTNQYLVREFRELAKNFDEEIIKELNVLFMAIY